MPAHSIDPRTTWFMTGSFTAYKAMFEDNLNRLLLGLLHCLNKYERNWTELIFAVKFKNQEFAILNLREAVLLCCASRSIMSLHVNHVLFNVNRVFLLE